MKRTLTILTALFCVLTLSAHDMAPQRMSPQEYAAKQREFITQRADLTEAEAEAFFPLYFELQREKMKLNGQVRRKMHEMYKNGVTEEQAAVLVDEQADMKIRCDELEKEYLVKFKALLPATKLLKVQMAEAAFQRELLLDMQRGQHPGEGKPHKDQPQPRH